MEKFIVDDMKNPIPSKLFYVGLIVLFAWFWYATGVVPVYVTEYVSDFTQEEKDVLSAYRVQPKAPWAKPGMSREELMRAFEESFDDPPEVDGTLWLTVRDEDYLLKIPAIFQKREKIVVEGGEDDLGYLPPRTDYSWHYSSENKNFLIVLSIYEKLPDKPDRWTNTNNRKWGYSEELHEELLIGNKTVLLSTNSANRMKSWIKGNNTTWYEISMGHNSSDEYLNIYALEQAYFKYIVYSFTIF